MSNPTNPPAPPAPPAKKPDKPVTAKAKPPANFDAYYDSSHGKYLVKDVDGNWMQVNDKGLHLHLEKAGYPRKKEPGQILSSAEAMQLWIQTNRNIIYAGPLAGYDAGISIQGGYKVLVTHSPTYVYPIGTDCSMIQQIISNMFDRPECNQSDYWHLWIKVADHCLMTKNFVPGPVCALAGSANSAKTLLSLIATVILGGRSACPYRYMIGESTFNKELIGAEMLIIDDEAASKDLRTRRKLGSAIKTMLFAGPKSGHGKGQNANSIQPFWRLMMLLNDEPENLLVMPPIDESLWDKIMLLKTYYSPMPMEARTPEDKALFWATILSQIPAYVGWLRYEFKIPSDFNVDSRTCVVPFKHPELLAELSNLLPENRLLDLTDNAILCDAEEWTGTQERFASILFSSPYGFEAKRLLDWSNAAGTYLGRLAKRYPNRVSYSRDKNSREWTIKRDPNRLYKSNSVETDPNTGMPVTPSSNGIHLTNRVFNQ